MFLLDFFLFFLVSFFFDGVLMVLILCFFVDFGWGGGWGVFFFDVCGERIFDSLEEGVVGWLWMLEGVVVWMFEMLVLFFDLFKFLDDFVLVIFWGCCIFIVFGIVFDFVGGVFFLFLGEGVLIDGFGVFIFIFFCKFGLIGWFFFGFMGVIFCEFIDLLDVEEVDEFECREEGGWGGFFIWNVLVFFIEEFFLIGW